MSDEIIKGLMPTDEELLEQGIEPDEDEVELAKREAKRQSEADGRED